MLTSPKKGQHYKTKIYYYFSKMDKEVLTCGNIEIKKKWILPE